MQRIPIAVKKIRGTYQPCRDNNEPEPKEPLGHPPAHLEPDEKKVWRELQRMVLPGWLTISDRHMVELHCQLMSKLRRRDPPLSNSERAQLTACLTAMGLTPIARTRVSVLPTKAEPEGDGIDQFLN